MRCVSCVLVAFLAVASFSAAGDGKEEAEKIRLGYEADVVNPKSNNLSKAAATLASLIEGDYKADPPRKDRAKQSFEAITNGCKVQSIPQRRNQLLVHIVRICEQHKELAPLIPDELVPVFVGYFEKPPSGAEFSRRRMMQFCGIIGPRAKAALPQLQIIAQGGDQKLAEMAKSAIKAIEAK